ncbi:winged helix DNA-binding domain-containing protein [Acidipropionibacterium jensenii]|uniref:winged helix DNA-binding domain-containing protein n=1 Tax=Acidipropionibacterium jensenii TaxID=1749 RepID=UPI00214CA710|nr:winged helix DNA-binding domain-containing protein [Acidipropionibacterium jensenii]
MRLDLSDPGTLSLVRMASLGLAPEHPDPAGDAPTRARALTATVSAIGALQSQDWPGAQHSLAMRVPGRSLEIARQAFNDGGLVRTWSLRGTLHTVAIADLPWMLAATASRTEHAAASRRAALGITEATLESALGVARQLLARRSTTRRGLFSTWRDEGLVGQIPNQATHILMTLCLRGHLALGPIDADGSQQVVGISLPPTVGDPLVDYVQRYFSGHGPATVEDLARWGGLTRTSLRPVLQRAARRAELACTEVSSPQGVKVLWHRPDLDQIPGPALQACRAMMLLSGFDELILGYLDRSCTVTPDQQKLVCPGGNGVFKHTIVENGRVVGTWRRGRSGDPEPAFFTTPTARRLRSFEAAAQPPTQPR